MGVKSSVSRVIRQEVYCLVNLLKQAFFFSGLGGFLGLPICEVGLRFSPKRLVFTLGFRSPADEKHRELVSQFGD